MPKPGVDSQHADEYCAELYKVEPKDFSNSDIKFIHNEKGELEGEVRSTRGGHDCPLPKRIADHWVDYAKSNPDWVNKHPIMKKYLAFKGIEVEDYTPTETQKLCAKVYNAKPSDIPRENIFIGRGTRLGWQFGEFRYLENGISCPLSEETIAWWTRVWNRPENEEKAKRYPALKAGLKFYRGLAGNKEKDRLVMPEVHDSKTHTSTKTETHTSADAGTDTHSTDSGADTSSEVDKVDKPVDTKEAADKTRFDSLKKDFEEARDVSVDRIKIHNYSTPAKCSNYIGGTTKEYKSSDNLQAMFFNSDVKEGKIGFILRGGTDKESLRKRYQSMTPTRLTSDKSKPLTYEKVTLMGRRDKPVSISEKTEIKSKGEHYYSKTVYSINKDEFVVQYCQFEKDVPTDKTEDEDPKADVPIKEDPKSTKTEPKARELVRKGVSGFGFDLQRELVSKNPDQNVMTSPASIAGALGMFLQGAEGDTLKEIVHTLKTQQKDKASPIDRSIFSQGFKALEHALKDTGDGVEIRQAYNVYPDKRTELTSRYKNRIKSTFGVDPKALDYRDPKEAAKVINADVEKATDGMIKGAVKEHELSSLKADGGLVATSAVYLKGKWLYGFDPAKTEKGTKFTKANGKTVSVDMMKHTPTTVRGKESPFFGWAVNRNYEMVSLPYKGRKYYMDIIIPKSGKMSEIQKQLAGADYKDGFVRHLRRSKDLTVGLPKFKLEFETSIKKPLERTMGSAFDLGKANFSSMISGKKGNISDVTHKVVMEVDEVGTRAAAITKGTFATASALTRPPPPIIADRPFVVVIRHTETGMPVFTATIQDPTKKASKGK